LPVCSYEDYNYDGIDDGDYGDDDDEKDEEENDDRQNHGK